MNRLSLRMILFIVVLSTLHMAAMTSLTVPAARLPQEKTTHPPVRAPVTLSSRQPIGALPTS
jgi:hypothetical protein